jgi:preprotein translocase subunit SecG
MPIIFWIGIAAHIFLCALLVLLVLVQNDKGGGLAGAFGGMGASSAFSSTGAASFISKLTRWVAIVFMAVVLFLNYLVTGIDTDRQTSDLKKAVSAESGLGSVLPEGITNLNIDSTLKVPE